MNLGDILIRIAFALSVLACVWLVPSLRRGAAPAGARPATWLFGLHALAAVGALVLLCACFLSHRFEFDYVSRYSSRALSPALTLAATWAGQEGSILLWGALGALAGLALLRQPGTLARPALFFVSLAQAWLFFLLLVKSPFARLPVTPPDGMGLNPLLEDPWMVIHPPVLFVGYAALVVPFAVAAAGLIRNELRDWNRMVWPWALFGVVSLGLGIGLGGVWAYKTLGWGGYWGWDPVENASLVPWLVSVGLVHGLLIERTTGSLKRTNLLLALLCWVTVVGGTYLTRSGILQDFSVHSFADVGLNTPLVTYLAFCAAAGAGLLLWRWRTIETGRASWTDISRESALWLGLMTVLVLAAFVVVGTTAPVTTALAGKPASVGTKFYEYVSVPVGILMVLLMALAPALRWSRQQGLGWMSSLAPGLIAGVLMPGALFVSGVTDLSALVLAAVSGLALAVNATMSFKLFRRGWNYGSGYLVHVGIAVMVFGMVASAMLGRSQRVTLVEGQPVQALGYTLTLKGMESGPRGERRLPVHVAKKDWAFEARPVLVSMPGNEGMMRKPAVDGWKDFYLSPLELAEAKPSGPVWLTKDQEMNLGGTRVTFTGFRMESHENMVVYADLRVVRDGVETRVSPGMRAGPSGSTPVDAEIPGMGAVRVVKIDADHGRVALSLPGMAGAPAAIMEVSTKPLINLVWIGALLALLGSALAGLRRAIERIPARAARPVAGPSREAEVPTANL